MIHTQKQQTFIQSKNKDSYKATTMIHTKQQQKQIKQQHRFIQNNNKDSCKATTKIHAKIHIKQQE